MNIKSLQAPSSTITFNRDEIEKQASSIYEAIVILGKRAEQINVELKSDLMERLEDFTGFNDTLEDVFENREQIEISKYFERLPKPTLIAIQEWLDGQLVFEKKA